METGQLYKWTSESMQRSLQDTKKKEEEPRYLNEASALFFIIKNFKEKCRSLLLIKVS